ncbi:ARM repeat superfamily protein [Rhynchospora pubera]|uniref:ARM repeat superfamily protein n=1 Tax=Rhynchospora pubera TaxID=906938 RepID=A0AAV8GMH8_9POAL|nr:ARM repeat superfamily protein [Rhynchospora pubera]
MSDSSPSSRDYISTKDLILPHIMSKNEIEKEMATIDMTLIQKSAKQLNFGSYEEKETAAKEIKRLAMADGCVKRLLAELGIVRSLVSMLTDGKDGDGLPGRISAAEALIELAKGTFRNKVLMVKAGLITKLQQLMDNKEFSRRQELPLLLLSISSLAKTNFHFATRQIFPFLIRTLNSKETPLNTRLTCLETLYNFSIQLDNIKSMVTSGAIDALLITSLDKETSEEALSVLSNLILSAEGKRGIENHQMAPKTLIEIMSREENPRCQELASYLVLVLAHGNKEQRRKMHECGIVPVLLQLALLGSPLAQKRALKILEWYKNEGQEKGCVHSGPRLETVSSLVLSSTSDGNTEQNNIAVKRMVKQSLDRNMTSLLQRATTSREFSSISEKALVFSSSSKSLPY